MFLLPVEEVKYPTKIYRCCRCDSQSHCPTSSAPAEIYSKKKHNAQIHQRNALNMVFFSPSNSLREMEEGEVDDERESSGTNDHMDEISS